MTDKLIKQSPFIRCGEINLRALTFDDVRQPYLDWLNDSDVLKWRGPKAFPKVVGDIEQYISSVRDQSQLVLAIEETATKKHLGNISLAHIQWVHRNAEINIMIGDADVRGRGLGGVAIKALAAHAFNNMGLHRVWAESPNPAFNATVAKLGWQKEGTKREAFLVDGKLVDITCWSLLSTDQIR
ncbi:GNAT family N-acetyltransferase [Thalassospira xiamenensis]|uniref:GNAT family N-acetyltransferase n=1 Tax=Thalassospira xiamenensis TaxID=220697 RepID=UPI000DEDCF92|nr:GNAT family protein [Thalassospira xiamenensis]RCK33565.1 hypothetical protein TH24_21180 [Thalassospira xiamenensis]